MLFLNIKKIRFWFQWLKRAALTRMLHLFCFCFRKRLQLVFLSMPDPYIISGNYFTMNWQARGCYKIIIGGSVILPGNATQASLDSRRIGDTLQIKFYGHKQCIEKNIALHMIRTGLKKDIALSCRSGSFQARPAWGALSLINTGPYSYSNLLVPVIPEVPQAELPSFIPSGCSFPHLHFEAEQYVQKKYERDHTNHLKQSKQ